MGDRYQDSGLVFAIEVGTPLDRHKLQLRTARVRSRVLASR